MQAQQAESSCYYPSQLESSIGVTRTVIVIMMMTSFVVGPGPSQAWPGMTVVSLSDYLRMFPAGRRLWTSVR